MSPFITTLFMLAFVFGGILLGLWLQKILPGQLLTTETKDIVGRSTAVIATISAIVLGLLVSSAKDNFTRFDDELTQNTARVIMLDRILSEYGPQTDNIRALIKSSYARRIELLFSNNIATKNTIDSLHAIAQEENIDSKLFALTPVSSVQQGLQARAIEMNSEINMTRTLIHLQREDSIPIELIMVLGIWLSLIFTTFGLFAPRNTIAIAALLACAISIAGATLLILEMNSPFAGLIRISSAPMYEALLYLGR
jgi:hypothetical protein